MQSPIPPLPLPPYSVPPWPKLPRRKASTRISTQARHSSSSTTARCRQGQPSGGTSPHDARFKETDSNGDVAITAEELGAAFAAKVHPEAQQKLKERHGDSGQDLVETLQKNGDGKRDQGELHETSSQGFKLMDSGGDGAATLEAVDSFSAQILEQIPGVQKQGQGEPPAR